MAVTEEAIREALQNVFDPELFVNIIDLGLVYRIDLLPQPDGQTDVKLDMTMTSPMCPAAPQLIGQSKLVLRQLAGVREVEVKIVLDPPWSPERMTEEARDQLGIF